jgi:hypothetical protein
VFGNDRIQGVQIVVAGASQPAGNNSGQPGGYTGKPGGPGMAGNYSGASGNPLAGLTTQGLGTFKGADYTLTAYGCTRIDTRVLCDFDIIKQNNQQVGLGPFANVEMVDDGGKVTARHDAYYMAADGTHLTAAFLSTTPVRYVMEYDDVAPQFNRVALVFGSDKLGGVPITAAGGTQPAGTMSGSPMQAAANGQPTTTAANGQSATTAANGAATQAGQAVNNAANAKKKAKSMWDQIKAGTVPSATPAPAPSTGSGPN